jgi:hypothetical protein
MARRWIVLLALAMLPGCGDAPVPSSQRSAPAKFDRVVAPIPGAYCEIEVEGVGTVDTESDYLPHVITCENGGANLERVGSTTVLFHVRQITELPDSPRIWFTECDLIGNWGAGLSACARRSGGFPLRA